MVVEASPVVQPALLICVIKYDDNTEAERNLDVSGDGELDSRNVTRLVRFLRYPDTEIH